MVAARSPVWCWWRDGCGDGHMVTMVVVAMVKWSSGRTVGADGGGGGDGTGGDAATSVVASWGAFVMVVVMAHGEMVVMTM
ncbi:hypothetical protein BVC80_1769g87 [Macleaya cordata]|uniref:Uncharacterized protein n=1 Tax=Macleaya cordata TaxID=56857 RepID=A0A200QTP4_MACCD|nr:hypothetical protein BVC80_1769g87 [Macleaya cordata]